MMNTPAVFELPDVDWDTSQQCMPKVLSHCALFGVSKSSDTISGPVAALQSLSVEYSGPSINQHDYTTLACCLQLVLSCRSYTFNVSASDLLLETGLSTQTQLQASLSALRRGALLLETRRYRFDGSLLKELLFDKKEKIYTIEMSPTIAEFFRDTVLIDRNIRKALGRDFLALWVYTFYASWPTPVPYKVETIWRLCGSQTKLLRYFRRDLKAAAARVAQKTGWEIWLAAKTDKLYVKRPVLTEDNPVSAPLAVATPAAPIRVNRTGNYAMPGHDLESYSLRMHQEHDLLVKYMAQLPADKYPHLHHLLKDGPTTQRKFDVARVIARCIDTELFDRTCKELDTRIQTVGIVKVCIWLRKNFPRPSHRNLYVQERDQIWAGYEGLPH